MALRLRPSSVSAKIFFAFLALLVTFGGVTAYGALSMRRLGDELRTILRGYLTLRLEVQEMQSRQDILVKHVDRPPIRDDSSIKSAIDTARHSRRGQLRKVTEIVDSLLDGEPTETDTAFLRDVRERLLAIERGYLDDEELFDSVYGPPRGRPLSTTGPQVDDARARLGSRETKLYKDLAELSKALRGRVHSAEAKLQGDERKALYATVLLAAIAALLGLGVLALAQRALAPLRRLAASAKLVGRGDLKQRVEVTSSDEIGTLAGEFNAMAAALEEREQRLIRSERLAAVGKIAAQITHEVRNPLSSIGLNAELILEELEGSKDAWASGEARELVRAIIGEVDRLAAITEQYLRLARLPRPKLEREDLNAVATSLLAFVHEEMSGRGITVERRFAQHLPAVPADENQLRQALLNLLRNAAEAIALQRGEGDQQNKRIIVTTALGDDPDRPVIISVADTGGGIEPENRAKIFDPFFSTKQGGTGLGLALTQQIVVEHGGAIDVDSTPGEGTRFTVRLPAMPAEEVAAAGPSAQTTGVH